MTDGMPLDPARVEEIKAEFAREKLMESFRDMLGDLAKLFEKTDGPFLLGQQASYADFIVGAWLRMSLVALPKSEWEEARSWHGGVFGRLHDALDVYAEVK
ncbi:hypothetical protein NM208_g2546 [Fusarium decemcellulare]|uniref:Uncharacterized protein n=1 Tax=Fusarium decemcellulare TaxID=57161 RepID=A0ACC1SS18_9HYPO|nr:hypothetical protein NM208_g2546 [Fusarium decemcellulare]